jgi:transposase
MIGSTRTIRVWAYPAPVDLRRGFDGLQGLVKQQLHKEPTSGELFLFTGRTRQSAKVLYWDGTGLCLLHKRLESGRFARLWPAEGLGSGEAPAAVALTTSELALFLEGSDLVGRVPLSPPEFRLRSAGG